MIEEDDTVHTGSTSGGGLEIPSRDYLDEKFSRAFEAMARVEKKVDALGDSVSKNREDIAVMERGFNDCRNHQEARINDMCKKVHATRREHRDIRDEIENRIKNNKTDVTNVVKIDREWGQHIRTIAITAAAVVVSAAGVIFVIKQA